MGSKNLLEASYSGYAATRDTTMDRLHTNIEIRDIWIDAMNCTNVKVRNTGETKLSNFDLWDILVVTEDQVFYITNYSASISLSDEILNPGILDPYENLTLSLYDFQNNKALKEALEEAFIIKVSTENGIVSSARYVPDSA